MNSDPRTAYQSADLSRRRSSSAGGRQPNRPLLNDDGTIAKAHYGIDAPIWLGVTLVTCPPIGLAYLWSSLVGKVRKAKQLISMIDIQPNSRVLDVGCGRGVLLIQAAKRVRAASGGRVTGIDIWSKQDQYNNSRQKTYMNCVAEGVQENIELVDCDARNMPFADREFDVVVSSFMLHNLVTESERKLVLQQMLRCVKPNGYVVILDIMHTAEYAKFFRERGHMVLLSGLQFLFFPMPTRYLIAKILP